MPDITMCKGTNCPLKEQCFRAQAKPDTYQSYFATPPYKDGSCDYFWTMKKENHVQKPDNNKIL